MQLVSLFFFLCLQKPVTPLIQPSFKIGDVFNEESEEIQKESEGVKD